MSKLGYCRSSDLHVRLCFGYVFKSGIHFCHCSNLLIRYYFSGHAKWNKRSCGVVCLVKDNPKRSYFIRVLDMDRKVVVFDQEIYNQFRYRSPRPYFHTFEAEDGQIGLNFAIEGTCFWERVRTHSTNSVDQLVKAL